MAKKGSIGYAFSVGVNRTKKVGGRGKGKRAKSKKSSGFYNIESRGSEVEGYRNGLRNRLRGRS